MEEMSHTGSGRGEAQLLPAAVCLQSEVCWLVITTYYDHMCPNLVIVCERLFPDRSGVPMTPRHEWVILSETARGDSDGAIGWLRDAQERPCGDSGSSE